MGSKKEKNFNPSVERQYSKWVYPAPVTDIAAAVRDGQYQLSDPAIVAGVLWPERAPDPEFNILVAGCGTSQAAWYAYTNPRARVLGVDLSQSSLDHSAVLKEKHGLNNLRLLRLDLNEIATLGETFDHIVSIGVLHHLPDPRHGLAALAEVLREDGVMAIMLYGKYLRAGVYMVQDAMARLGLRQTDSDVTFARQIIGALPSWHSLHSYLRVADDLNFDGGIVDTFLHPQDRAFSVPEVLSLVEECGLVFQGWLDNLDYYPDACFAGFPLLLERVCALPEPEQWAIVELLAQSLGTHRFNVRKRQPEACRPFPFFIDCDGPTLLEMVPARREPMTVTDFGDHVVLQRRWHNLMMTGLDRELFLSIDGTRSVGALMRHCRAENGPVVTASHQFFHRLWRLGHITLCHYARAEATAA